MTDKTFSEKVEEISEDIKLLEEQIKDARSWYEWYETKFKQAKNTLNALQRAKLALEREDMECHEPDTFKEPLDMNDLD